MAPNCVIVYVCSGAVLSKQSASSRRIIHANQSRNQLEVPVDQHLSFNRSVNYALVLLLLSLLVYSSIGLTLTVSPAQAEALPVGEMPAVPAPESGRDVWIISFTPSQSP